MSKSAYFGLAVALSALLANTTAAADRPVAVSPGSGERIVEVSGTCPTFSWTAIPSAQRQELVVYAIEEGAGIVDGAGPLLRTRLPGAASSWTPSLRQCLRSGQAYTWSVRAVGKSTSDWSEPRLFRVSPLPSATEVEEALLVLKAYLAAGGTPVDRQIEASQPTERPIAKTPGLTRPQAVALADAVAIRGELPDLTGVTFGVHGLSASADANSAGVVGESTAATGATFGVVGEVDSAAGTAGAFDNTAGGKILSGLNNGSEVFSLDGAGDLALTGLVDGVDVSAHPAAANAHHTPPTALPPSGAAGGDLSGTFPNPDVVDDSHAHTSATVPDLWVDTAGDTMTGQLTLDPGVNLELGGQITQGATPLLHTTTGAASGNTGVGLSALTSATPGSPGVSSGTRNTAIGNKALHFNTSGAGNTAIGDRALYSNSSFGFNTAVGVEALEFNYGSFNTAVGAHAHEYWYR